MVNLSEITVNLWMTWKNIGNQITKAHYTIKYHSLRIGSILLRIVPLSVIIAVARLLTAIHWVPRYLRLNNHIAQQNYQQLCGDDKPLKYIWNHQRKKVFELAATWGCHRKINQQLAECAQKLSQVVENEQGQPIILAPLHMFSDVLAVMVAGQVVPHSTTVIVSSGVGEYTRKDRQRVNLDIDYCSIHFNSQDIAEKMMAAMSEASEGKRKIIIFPDITPDFTAHTNQQRSSRIACTLFGRRAHLHNGIPRIARVLGARVIFYYLTYDKKIDIHIAASVEAKEVKDVMPQVIEAAMRQHPNDWLLWHSHSLFFVNG